MEKPTITLNEAFADEYQRGYEDGEQGKYNPNIDPSHHNKPIHFWISTATQDELRTLRAIINGKLGKRTISKEQQLQMQSARVAKRALATQEPRDKEVGR